ncbi:MAG: rod shape-determining protein MreD [Gammaproteobacteria bacterium]|nr:rod shape-determining protein MreD [Gammaproteobacteria bacterium]MDH5593431.1 rod shape-determining protein MreD [Gammaproteobacteria bacterium]
MIPLPRGFWVIWSTFFLAMVLMLIPLPEWARIYQPQWAALVLIYWCLALPERVGVGTAWVLGLMLDVLTGTLLGQHALGLSIVAYLTLKMYQRLRVFPMWQQALSIMVLVAMQQMVSLWVLGIIDTPPDTWTYWISSITSLLLWPWVYLFLRNIRRAFQIL